MKNYIRNFNLETFMRLKSLLIFKNLCEDTETSKINYKPQSKKNNSNSLIRISIKGK